MPSWQEFEQEEPEFAARVQSEPPDGTMFVADINEVVITRLDPEATKLVVESWTPTRGHTVTERA